ncbi:MAG TPA: GatB/YqeY domain-containing protein [Chitinivibrionales bacterium]|nr:GatB/YqeY domain-containing protein [Chitinivibrionales bacterium]
MPSSILETLLADIKAAMKSQEKEKLLALRTLHSEIKNLELMERKELDDGNVAGVIAKAIKQRMESIEQYKTAGRTDLVEKEQAQADLYKKYLPGQLTKEEIEGIIDRAVAEAGAQGKADMGRVMKIVMPQVKGRADGKTVNETVARKLGKPSA